MKQLNMIDENKSINKFWSYLENSTFRILFLDYDGTIAPFKNNVKDAFPYDGIPEILDEIMNSDRNKIFFITGRTVYSLKEVLKTKNSPEIWGCHGWERLDSNGHYRQFSISENTKKLINKLLKISEEIGLKNYIEYKTAGFTIHYRGFSKNRKFEIRERVELNLIPIIADSNISSIEYEDSIEFRIKGRNKGNAVLDVLKSFPDDVVFAYLGDDLTDEDAFKVIGHAGLRVLVREELRQTNADIWLKPPEELLQFLRRWSDL